MLHMLLDEGVKIMMIPQQAVKFKISSISMKWIKSRKSPGGKYFRIFDNTSSRKQLHWKEPSRETSRSSLTLWAFSIQILTAYRRRNMSSKTISKLAAIVAIP